MKPRLRYFSGDHKPKVLTDALVEYWPNSDSRTVDTCVAVFIPAKTLGSTDLSETLRSYGSPGEYPEMFDVIDNEFWLQEGWYVGIGAPKLESTVHRWTPLRHVVELVQAVEAVYRVGSCTWTFVPHRGIMYEPWEGEFVAGCDGSKFSRLIQSKKQYPDYCPACGGAVVCSTPQE